MSNIWFLSDPHWGHAWVAKLRGHDSVHQHDLWMIDMLQDTIKKDDVTWWLGDLAMGNPTYALAMIDTIPGTHHLIAGNHDQCHSMHRGAARSMAQYYGVFKSVQSYARRRVEGAEVLLSHLPYSSATNADHTATPRYSQYRLPDLGRPLLHGHTHGQERVTHTIHNTRQIHVGLDAWRRPVHLNEITEMLR